MTHKINNLKSSFLGLIKDFSGSYIGCIIFLNICTVTTIFMYSIEMIYFWCKEKHSTEN